MYPHLGTLRKTCLGLGALTVLLALPAVADAASMGFRNELKIPILVQGECVTKTGITRKGPLLAIFPGKAAYDTNLKAHKRTITIYHGKTNQVLFRLAIPFDGNDIIFRVVRVPITPADPTGVRLVPLKGQ
jgi:hypothetical protein